MSVNVTPDLFSQMNDDLLAQALKKYNDVFMDNLPESTEIHDFSRKFERRMGRLLRAESRFGGKRWLEACTRYVAVFVFAILGFVAINTISVKAFHIDLWEMVVTKTTEFIHINFQKNSGTHNDRQKGRHMLLKNDIAGYKLNELYQSEELTVQQFVSENGTITYTESLITESANVNIAQGEKAQEMIGEWEVTFVEKEANITVFFLDEMYYHIIEIQGENSNREFAVQMIENLEA